MIKLFVVKEIKNILLSPKFVATFMVCSILILLSIFIGIKEYQSAVKQYEAGTLLTSQDLRERTSWMGISLNTYRKPDPMQIFVSGVSNDIGRKSTISQFEDIKLRNSSYSDDPIYAVFRFIDLAFIVQIVLSLLAIMFTYDAVNGERESGMLKLIFANPVPRIKYILAKFIGSWLGLIIPLTIPLLLGTLLVLVYRIPLTDQHWIKLLALTGFLLLYFTFFIVFGLLISTLTRNSAISFLVLLVFWVTFVLIIPRVGTMLAGQFIEVPTVAEIESQVEGYSEELWTKHDQELTERWRQRNAQTEGMSTSERKTYQDENMWSWMEEDQAIRDETQKKILEYSRKLKEDLRNRKIEQERLGYMLSRFSPASSYLLAVMNVAGTDIGLKSRYDQAMDRYRQTVTDFMGEKKKKEGGQSGIQITLDSDRGLNINTPELTETIDASELPQFVHPQRTLAVIIKSSLIDAGFLLSLTLICFIISVWIFERYDLR